MRKLLGPKPLYIRRRLFNGEELFDWAAGQGITALKSPTSLHVTVAFSRTAVHWASIVAAGAEPGEIAFKGGTRAVSLFDKGAVALEFEAPALAVRQAVISRLGASWDYPTYRPHVTVGFAEGVIEVAAIRPFEGELRFGPEIFADLPD